MAIQINDTLSMLHAIERVKAPASFLVDTFFPQIPPVAISKAIGVEFRKGHRRIAPFVVDGGHGVNMKRIEGKVTYYEPPMLGPSRTVSESDISGRMFGEAVLGSLTPEQRAAQIQARDFMELQGMIQNRKNKMAADLLTKGELTINGYADDGNKPIEQKLTVEGWTQNKISANWAAANADILGDIRTASESIQESAGMVPTVMICGRNILNYMLSNDAIGSYLKIRRENLAYHQFAPKITAPQAGYIGRLDALNLEMYTYFETYTDEDGTVKPFLGPDDVIIGLTGRGKQLHGAVSLVDRQGNFQTYAAAMVPKYISNENSNTLKLTMFSRCLLVPETADDWYHIDAGV